MEPKDIYDQVNKRYGSINKSSTGQYEQTVARAFGYTEEELAGIPEGANLGLSCGNPLALAKLRERETVIDLGSGAGFDVFAAAKRVGPSGKAIGVDMNKNMIEKANDNKAKANAENVEFIEGTITSIPLPDNTADCIISNCVINLVPAAEKQTAFHEMYRLLKPGGRVALSDILTRKELTEDMKKNIALYVRCISGASEVNEYESYLKKAGFRDPLIVDSKNDLNVYLNAAGERKSFCGTVAEKVPTCCSTEKQAECCRPEQKESCCDSSSSTCGCKDNNSSANEAQKLADTLGIMDFNEWAGSFQVYAVKPMTN
ncbi:SAM-dependent methyltransferase UbiE/COQ5 family protein [Tricladium varicosporioides]|nr:SAM-dependent methyltransferase UbiE/COQ5 family protein [Hymenoscyphus varicosporioides]